MISVVTKPSVVIEDYKGVIDDSLFDEIHELAQKLRDVRVCHVNATSYGGGVAEILQKEIPLAKSLDLKFDWKTISAYPAFFDVTKKIHNALQGNPLTISDKEWQVYSSCNIDQIKQINPSDYDVFFIHDPQPAEIINCIGKNGAKWVWRCHIDTSEPNQKVADYFLKFLDMYDASIFTMADYVLKGMDKNIFIIPPAIDALSEKNRLMNRKEAKKIVERFGVDTTRPIATQVSRFDPWKDPIGVVESYKIAKAKVPNLQLVMIGSMADDDPEGEQIFKEVKRHASGDKDIFLLSNQDGVHDLEVNAFQTYSDVIMQKSTKEGFGLTVSEALWKETPVIGGNVGGIPTQIEDGKTGFLVNSKEECAEKIVYLIQNKDIAHEMGKKGREVVRQNFLLPRLLRDELKVIEQLTKD
ncbi:MAG: glycosyltransferase [bacterium]|nr:glycosyltransferase [bacterium]